MKIDEIGHRMAIGKYIRVLHLYEGDWAVTIFELDCLIRFVFYCAFQLADEVNIAFEGSFVAGQRAAVVAPQKISFIIPGNCSWL